MRVRIPYHLIIEEAEKALKEIVKWKDNYSRLRLSKMKGGFCT